MTDTAIAARGLPAGPVEIPFTPAEPAGPKQPGTGWLQPGGLVVHTGWSRPLPPPLDQPYRQHDAYDGCQSWIISTPDGHEAAAFAYYTRERAEQAAAAIAAALPAGTWPTHAPGRGPLHAQAFDASTGPEMLPAVDGRGRPDWGFGAGWVNWRMPPTRDLYHRMIEKHGGSIPTRYCSSCRSGVARARRAGWTPRPGHWPRWGDHRPGSVRKTHCMCVRCIGWVTVGALGEAVDEAGRTVPGVRSACTDSPIMENGREVPREQRPFAWFRTLLAEAGHVILDNRPCTGLWPDDVSRNEGVRHDDAFLCETGFAGVDEP